MTAVVVMVGELSQWNVSAFLAAFLLVLCLHAWPGGSRGLRLVVLVVLALGLLASHAEALIINPCGACWGNFPDWYCRYVMWC